MEINVMITCVASQVIPKITNLVRSFPSKSIRIIGVDSSSKENAVGAIFSDIFYQIPNGFEENYIDSIIEIIQKEAVQIILPGSDEEVLSLSKHKELLLKKYNCHVVCSDYSTTLLASNKFEMLKKIQSHGLHTGLFAEINQAGDIYKFAESIEFPKREFIIKPKTGRGSKGVKLITSNIDRKKRFLAKDNFFISIQEAVDFFTEFPEEREHYFMMEYFSGEKFSTDLLIQDGQIKHFVTRSNGIFPKINPPTQLADIVFDNNVLKYVMEIQKIANFDFFLQIETGYDEKGNIGFIESNARLDATLPITLGVGVNYYHEFIRYSILEESFKNSQTTETPIRFFRYWEDTFTKN